MSEVTARYRPGTWVAVASGTMWLVADLDQRDPVINACWALVAEAAGVDEVLTALVDTRLRPALNLAVVRLHDGGAEVLVRGEVWAEIGADSPAGQETLEVRAGQGSFGDTKVDHFDMISLHLPGEEPAPPQLVLGTGVVLVSEVAIIARHPVYPASEPQIEEASVTVSRFDAMFGKTVHPVEQELQTTAVPQEWMSGMRRSIGTPAEPPAEPPAGLPSGLSGVEVNRGVDPFNDVSWATVLEEPSGGPDPYDEYHAAHPAPASYQPPQDFELPPDPAAGGIDPELLQTVQRPPSPQAITGPMVEAVRCPSGHLNPPVASRCRICGGGIAAQSPQRVPRPKLGALRLSTKEIVPLDRGVILGRAPGAPDGFGRDEPYRVQLPSPDGSMSRKHVEVVLEGWTVTVVDLKSTNGTQVTPPGGMPEVLPSGGSRVIDHGWIVNLDATTYFRFEVTE